MTGKMYSGQGGIFFLRLSFGQKMAYEKKSLENSLVDFQSSGPKKKFFQFANFVEID